VLELYVIVEQVHEELNVILLFLREKIIIKIMNTKIKIEKKMENI
jgi:hypothetical protein